MLNNVTTELMNAMTSGDEIAITTRCDGTETTMLGHVVDLAPGAVVLRPRGSRRSVRETLSTVNVIAARRVAA